MHDRGDSPTQSRRQDRCDWRINDSPPPSPRLTIHVPDLPWNVTRRIIHFRLALTPSIPPRLNPDGPVTIEWDGLAGRIGIKARQKRVEARKGVMDAVGLLRVCKAWRNIVLKYIYTEPHLTDANFFPFARAILAGDKKWDDLRVHPHSVPGRYVSTLDLSAISISLVGPGNVGVLAALRAVLPVLPNITHIKLPQYYADKHRIVDMLAEAACKPHLRALEGLKLQSSPDVEGSEATEREAFCLLQQCSRLEYLAVESFGASILNGVEPDHAGDMVLDLPYLHTLHVEAWTPAFLSVLARSPLPRLQRLITPNIYDDPGGGEDWREFKMAHAQKMLSLTFLPMHHSSNVWATIQSPRILDDHPELLHLSFLSPPFDPNEADAFAESLHRPDHPLTHITLHKWDHPEDYPPSPSNFGQVSFNNNHQPHPRTARICETIVDSPPPHLKSITIDGNTWVSPKLGRAALSTGISAEMRSWASRLNAHEITLRDMEGQEVPRAVEEENGLGRGRRLSRNNDQRVDRVLWDPYRGATRRAQSRMQGDDQDGG